MSLPGVTDHQGCPAYIIKCRNSFLMTRFLKFFFSVSLLSLCQIYTQQETSSLHYKSHCFMLLFLSCMWGILFPKACCFHFSFSFFLSIRPHRRLKELFWEKKKKTYGKSLAGSKSTASKLWLTLKNTRSVKIFSEFQLKMEESNNVRRASHE